MVDESIAAGQKRAERHVRHHFSTHRPAKQRLELVRNDLHRLEARIPHPVLGDSAEIPERR